MNPRLESIVAQLNVAPIDTVLEIGCGHGVAASLICERLTGARGRYVAIDRSKKMIASAEKRNAEHVAAGKAEFHVAALESFDPGGRKFDKILAVRVAAFHREPDETRRLVERWLKPRGKLLVVYDEPAKPSRA